MTISELLNGVIYTGTLASALSGIGALIYLTAVRPFTKFLRREIVENLVEIKDAINNHSNDLMTLRNEFEYHVQNGGHT